LGRREGSSDLISDRTVSATAFDVDVCSSVIHPVNITVSKIPQKKNASN